MQPIPYGKQSITPDDIEAVVTALQSDYLTQGPKILEFEQAFSKYIGAKFSVAVSNGTAALHLCAMALNVNKASNVITTPITFAASANCIRYCGGNVFFADINPLNYCLEIQKVEELIQSKPEGFFQGIIPVDFAGYTVNMEEYRELANRHNLWIIEDACHAPGGSFVDSFKSKQNAGNGKYADMAIFSFHPVKHIACGEGGMVTTNNEELYRKMILLRTHGITKDSDLLTENHGGWYYEMQELGYNYRLTDMQAALGISQLIRANDGLEKRRKIAAVYYEAFRNNRKILGQSSVVEGHAYHLYIIEVEDRKGLYDFLRSKGIYAQVHYIPVHTFPYYKQINTSVDELSVAENYYSRCLSLPMYPTLTNDEQLFVIQSVKEFLGE